ncbi:MAG: aldo/keto reductase [Clostridiales bacterium]|nr:aldo/keto reductase [Clostridiales bacterium]
MNRLTDTYTLQNGLQIPVIGFGTWQVADGEEARKSVLSALEAGYRHIDTAQAYENEQSVGQGIRDSGVPREQIFLTSKLRNPVRGYEETLAAFDESLRLLGTDYLDLFLLHWPRPRAFHDNWEHMNAESWRAMETLFEQKKLRALGISNFRRHHIDALLKTAKVAPQVNQIRLAPGETQDDTVDYSREKGMLLEAYSPLGVGRIFEVPQMQELAEKYGRTIAQIAIRWSLQRGYLPMPKSITPERIRENARVFDFELSADDVQRIADMKGVVGYARDPDDIPF